MQIYKFFSILFLSVVLSYCLIIWKEIVAAKSWPTTSATVVEKKYNSDEGWKVVYEYEVGDQRFRSDRLNHNGLLWGNKLWDPANAYRKGGTIEIHYYPDNPSRSVVELEYPASGYALICLCVVFGYRTLHSNFARSGTRSL